MIYWISDLHLHHDNIIDYCNRPCTKENHNEWIMSHFEPLKAEDTLYILGDITCNSRVKLNFFVRFFSYFKDKGVLLYIAIGNHDERYEGMMREAYKKVFGISSSDYIKHYFCLRNVQVSSTHNITTRIIMAHYPFGSWDQSHRGSINLFGHTHGFYKHRKKFQYDVGLDVKHKIFSLEDIEKKYLEDLFDGST